MMRWREYLADKAISSFIRQHEKTSLHTVALKLAKTDSATAFILRQIAGRQVALNKFPALYENEDIVYPQSISLQQSSSETTASFKASLVKGNIAADLTGGFGIDAMAFAKKFNRLYFVEENDELLQVVKHNFKVLEITNCTFINGTAEEFLINQQSRLDFIYLDPSRRGSDLKRVYKLEDCSPSLPDILENIMGCSDQFMFKAAPFLDISITLKEIDTINQVHVIAVENECKEVLYHSANKKGDDVHISTRNFEKNKLQELNFKVQDELNETAMELSDPLKFLYEPNAAILKAGAFKTLGKLFDLKKIHDNSHLYTSNALIHEFPGKMYEVLRFGPVKSKFWRFDKHAKYRIKTRNVKISKEDILKKLGIKEGGEYYLIATTDMKDKSMVIELKVAETT